MAVRRATRQQRWVDASGALGALVGILVLLIGVPVALIAWVGWPLPTEVPGGEDVSQALRDTDISEDFLVKVLALVCWFVWVELVASLLVEAVAYARGREAAQVPLGGGVQRAAARLIATVALLGALSASRGAPEAAELVLSPLTDAASAPAAELVSEDPNEEPSSPSSGSVTESETPPALPVYEVQWRDTLWAISEAHLGDPLRWQEIYGLNQGRQFDDGRVFNDPDLIHPGWRLDMPADAVGLDQPAQDSPPDQPEPEPDPGPDPEPDPLDGGDGPGGPGAGGGPVGPGGMGGMDGPGGPGSGSVGDGWRSRMVLREDPAAEPEPGSIQYAEGPGEVAAGAAPQGRNEFRGGGETVAGEPPRSGMMLWPDGGVDPDAADPSGSSDPSDDPSGPGPVGPIGPVPPPGEELAVGSRRRRRPDADGDGGEDDRSRDPGPDGDREAGPHDLDGPASEPARRPAVEADDTPVPGPPPAGGQG